MPNSFITLIDSKNKLTEETVLDGIANIPFAQHQYKWLIGELRELPQAEAVALASSYGGVKKLSPYRLDRIKEVCRVVSNIPDLEFNKLPEVISPPLARGTTVKQGQSRSAISTTLGI